MRMLMQKSGLVWEIDNVCLFLTYEVQSANSSPFISLCIVYSNIGHRAHKSSPCSAKTAPFVCTVLTDSILCPLTSSPQLLLSAQLCPLKYINWSVHSLSSENQLCFCFFWVCEICNLWKKKIKKYIYKNCDAFRRFPSACARLQTFPVSLDVLSARYLVGKIKVYRRFPWLFVSAGERAQKVRRNCKRVDTQSGRRAFVWERKMIYCHRGGSNRVHGELWWRRGGAKLWSCWASISYLQFKECVQGCEARKTKRI